LNEFEYKYNKRVLVWHFTLVLIKINYGQIGDQTGLFHITNPVFYTGQSVRWKPMFGYVTSITSFLAHLAKGNVSFCHHLASVVCHILILSSETLSATRMACGGHVC
jgi:hypothetical protein